MPRPVAVHPTHPRGRKARRSPRAEPGRRFKATGGHTGEGPSSPIPPPSSSSSTEPLACRPRHTARPVENRGLRLHPPGCHGGRQRSPPARPGPAGPGSLTWQPLHPAPASPPPRGSPAPTSASTERAVGHAAPGPGARPRSPDRPALPLRRYLNAVPRPEGRCRPALCLAAGQSALRPPHGHRPIPALFGGERSAPSAARTSDSEATPPGPSHHVRAGRARQLPSLGLRLWRGRLGPTGRCPRPRRCPGEEGEVSTPRRRFPGHGPATGSSSWR